MFQVSKDSIRAISSLKAWEAEIVSDAINQAVSVVNTRGSKYALAHFLSQISVESGFKPIDENLSYSAKRMRAVFGSRGRRKKLYSQTKRYARNPKNLANYVYANRMGNKNESSGDGYRFRGRGFLQITGRYNYEMIGRVYNELYGELIDFTLNPDELLEVKYAARSAVCWWYGYGLNKIISEKTTVTRVTRKVNGGLHSLRKRQEAFRLVLPTLIQEGGNISDEPNMALNSFTKDEIDAINKIMTA